MSQRIALTVACLCSTLTILPECYADWPAWRYDAARSGSTPHKLPQTLHLQWTRQMPAPTPAWPASQPKLQFDAAYEPVVAGGKLIIGSSRDGTVRAFDIVDGSESWRFFTEAPVRFAPAIADGRVYVVSDDGRLYCLRLADGHEVWRFEGAPRTRRIIGNDRLISMWPARGGVVVADGVAYFTAGIWPSMGVFVQAVDAKSGEVIWNNSTTGSRYVTHPHGAKAFGSISPQGYLAIAGENVIVPGGRTLPGVFDRSTGEMKHFEFGGKGEGGYEVFAAGDFYFATGLFFHTQTNRSAGRFPARIASADAVLGTEGSRLLIMSPEGSFKTQTVKDRRGRKVSKTSFQPKSHDQLELDGPSMIQLRAGDRVFASGNAQIASYNLDTDKKTLTPDWTAKPDADAASMIASDGRLFVSTTTGQLLCFGEQKRAITKHGPDDGSFAKLASDQQSPTTPPTLQRLIDQHLPDRGFVLSLGVPSFRTVDAVTANADRSVVVLESNGDAIRHFRETASNDPRFGVQVTAIQADVAEAGLPSYFASIVLAEANRDYDTNALKAIFDCLRPYGGLCYLPTTSQQHSSIVSILKTSVGSEAAVKRIEELTVIQRVGPLPGAGEWSHQYGDAANTVVSTDQRVRTPLGMLWFGGPSNDQILPRHGHGPSPQVAGGRLFIEGANMLRCVDVYTGQVWWERDFPGLGRYYDNTAHHPGAGEIGSNYVSLADHVYVVYGESILELDATTGRTTKTIKVSDALGTAGDWGAILVEGDVLIATAIPTGLPRSSRTSSPKQLTGTPIVERGAKWRYVAGIDPPDDWAQPAFDASKWKTGEAGFGYGDGDDRTKLDMRNKFGRVYIRHEFDLPGNTKPSSVKLAINFDDAFIAYINGHEFARVNVGTGRGRHARGIGSHEARSFESFDLGSHAKWLKSGRNVLAIEGHNTNLNSSDFSLDPYLLGDAGQQQKPVATSEQPSEQGLTPFLERVRYASGSRKLVAFDRHSGKKLWSRDASLNFRHNAICAADDKLFCIDNLTSAQRTAVERRGGVVNQPPALLALDLRTGSELWTTGKDVFGTFLNYSREHDLLIQGGSAYRDRAKDEVGQGLIAYRGSTGEVVWQDLSIKYGGPCLLRRDRIITNGGGGFEINLLTGQSTGWKYARMYGCNTAIGSEHLLTFRSGAAGFCDLAGDSGTGNLGGFRSSCTSNIIVADGVLNAPDYTRTCRCAYQLQTSLAMVHMPEVESWTYGHTDFDSRTTGQIAINLGAPGDRRLDDTLWFDYPAVGGPSPKLDVSIEPKTAEQFARHTLLMADHPLHCVGASGLVGVRKVQIDAPMPSGTKAVTVRLVFAEPAAAQPGERVFSISINGTIVEPSLDIAQQAPRPNATVSRSYKVPYNESVEIELTPTATSLPATLSGISVTGSTARSR